MPDSKGVGLQSWPAAVDGVNVQAVYGKALEAASFTALADRDHGHHDGVLDPEASKVML
ncbi:hypothetical protein [Arthrobacter nitrophenolicus]|uniref:Uncharacterized protein n=1 Tax=Arthrobacter nitrophenolicus TaxID=683150 RepID=A0ACC6TFZ7_9MICC